MKSVLVTVYGRVQGVGYRMWTLKNAERLALSGWVKNNSDGTVSAAFSGGVIAVDEMLTRVHSGPPYARVDRVEAVDWDSPSGDGFEIRE